MAESLTVDRYNQSDYPAGPELTDFSHCCILPPLIDSHAHLCMSGTLHPKSRQEQLTAGYETLKKSICRAPQPSSVSWRTCRAGWGRPSRRVIRYFRELDRSDTLPVVVRSPGKAWYRAGPLRWVNRQGRRDRDATGPGGCWRKRSAVDHLKIVNSGMNSLKQFGHQTRPQFSGPELGDTVCGLKIRG